MILGTAAPILADSAISSATVDNSAPVVMTVSESPDPVNLNPGGNTEVAIEATVEDLNGFDDISKVEYSIDGGQTWTGMGYDDLTGKATGTLTLTNEALPVDQGVTVRATDKGGKSGEKSDTFKINELLAIAIDFLTVDFGVVNPGLTADIGIQGSIKNNGNVVTDVRESALWVAPAADFITSGQVGILGNVYDISTGANFDADIGVGSSAAASFGLFVPPGTNPGFYNGQITFEAITVP